MSLTWKCACGKFTAEMKSAPFLLGNCHCHSCVAPARYCDEKFGKTNRSALSENGGCAKAFFYLKDVAPGSSNPPLKFLKVGDGGKNIRSYTSCCGTLLNTAGGAVFPIPGGRPFSRNNLFNADGSKFNPGPVADFNMNNKFDDYPTPPDNGVAFNRAAFGEAAKKTAGESHPAYYQTPSAETDTVPITWPEKAAKM